MKTTKILSLIALLLCFTLNLRAQSGTCGTNLTWKLVNDTLIITGSGAMDNSRPWSSYSSKIVHVSISEGVTNICDNAFVYHRKLLSVIIPNTVTSIGKEAFYDCSSLTQITMSNAVETIGSSAFNKTAITSVTLPSTLISLGTYAFNNCTQLAEITIPGSLSSIADDTFYNCTSLRKLVIEEGVKTIGANAFEGCSKLNDITIPEGVTSIDINAFQGCSRITEISLPSSLINLGGSVFYGCSSLASIVIPENITSVENHTFYGCTSLKEVTLPQTILKIEEYAFRDCAFTQFTIPSSATEIQAYAFSYCKNLTSITLPSGMTKIPNNLFDHCSSLTSIVIPEGVTAIETGAFWECTSLTSVTIPEGVTSIYGEAFYNCSLTTLTLPNSLEEIGNSAYCNSCGGDYLGAFAHNTKLTSVVIPKNVSRIGSDAFEGCTSLSQITLQEGLKEIGANAFLDCGALRSIIIPEGVTTIGEDAFANCRLTEISLPRSLKTIGDNGVFQGNKFLTSVTIYGGVERIGSYAFDGCTSLSQVTLHEGITTIGKFAFQNCSSLRSITLPEGVTTIEGGAFYNCDLRDISLPQSLTIVNDAIRLLTNGPWYGAFANNPNLTTIVIPNNVTHIGSYTFSGCHSLKNIVLNDNLLTLGTGIFNDCFAMESITFPKNITAIPATAFHECYALSEVNLPEGLISIGELAFAYCSSLKTVQLPKTVTSLYRSFATSGVVEMDIPEGVAVLESTFDGCSKLKKVTLPSTLTTLGAYTFKNCTSLPTITLPQGLLTLGSYVFSGCTALDSITLPSQLTSIGEEAFMSCSALRNITIPNSVKSIGNKAFGSCTALREITIPNQVSYISPSLFSGCTALSSVTLPNSITKIYSSAFDNCTALQEITLPEGLTAIGSSAFYNCSALRSLTIPSTVVDLTGSAIFNACKSLSNLNLLPLTPPSIKNSNSGSQYQPLYGTPSTMKINLVCGAKEAYMADANWAKLTYPINEIFSNILTIKSNDNRMGEAYIPTPNTCDNDTAIIEALPREGYQFAAWHDGNTDNPRTILVTQDTTFTANFEPLTTYQLTVNYDPKQGHISGIGEYYPNEEATLTVTPLGGYRFKQWGDGNTDNPRTIIMTQDTTLEALFIMGDYCGDDILYTFLNDTLALNGTGDMWNLSQYGWYMYADEVSALTLSNGITSIGTNAFMNLMFLPEVTIPASVKTIHKRAFENCRSLASVTFAPKSQLQTIDHWAFYECINLKALEIPEGVTTIGNGAFYGCAYLDSIVLPASMMSIADNGFAQCTKLSAMTVHAITPPAVDSKTFESVNRAIPVYVPFGTGAIYRATPIWQEFNIREMGAESNDNKIFYTSSDGNIITPKTQISSWHTFGASIISNVYENGIGTITFDGTVTSIGQSAFRGCSSLTSITIPNSVKVIDNLAFQGCISLSSVTIPDSVMEIGWMAFGTCESLISITVEDKNSVYDSRENCNAIIRTDDNTLICGCQTTVIPTSITKIGEYAFSGLNLTSITIPHNVTLIGDFAFDGCWELSTVFVNAIEPPILGTDVFYQDPNNPKLWCYYPCGSRLYYEESDWKNQVDYLIEYCGENANEIRYTTSNGYIIEPYNKDVFGANFISSTYENGEGVITFDGPVTSIGELAFYGLPDLTSLLIPSDVTYIAPGAISYCSSLASLIVSSDNTTYDSRDNCNAIIDTRTNTIVVGCKNTIIPKSVTGIGWYAFDGCRELTSIIIPSQITYVGTCAFRYCSSLISIAVEDGNARYDSREDCNAIIETKSNTLVAGFQSTIIPNSVVRIEDYAFLGNSNLTSIAIPNSVTSIGSSAFSQCYDLDTVYCYATIPPSLDGSNTFQNYDATLYVPCEALDTYKADAIWGKFSNIQCITSPSDPCEDIVEIDWHAGIRLSQLTTGWYKFNIADIHANKSDVTSLITNDLVCPTRVTRAYYANCEDEEPLFEGSATYELGATQQTMTYADFANIVPAHVDYLYLNIASIVEDCEPTDPCEDIVEINWHAGIRLSQLTTGWYKFNIADIHANKSDVTSLITNDLVCPTRVTRAYYANCEDEEPLFEGSATYELGATQQTMTYADFANIVPAHVDYLYLNIASIVEDCEPTPPCEDIHTEEYATICYGEIYTWNGQTYSTEGEYSVVLSSVNGCDSVVTLNLTVLPEAIITEEIVTINETHLPYIWRNKRCYESGKYIDSESFANYPYCDSVIYVLNLIVEAPNKCGPNLYWHYSNNTMTITGHGEMYDDPDLLSYRTQDWYPARVNNVILPEKITHIGNVAFADCSNLTNIAIPSSVTSIGDGAFSWTGLQSITIPASVTTLGEQVFETCNDLLTILYEGNPTTINNQTVHPLIGCVHLNTIIAPAALWHCTNADPALENRYGVPHKARYIEVTDGFLTNQAIKYIANNATALEVLDLTNATNTTLPYGALSNSYQLTQLYLPEQIEVIPESMIEGGRNLLEIVIPATVTEIGNYAFAGCINVWHMTVEATTPPTVYENTFDGVSRSISVLVPAGSEKAYREAEYWREFFIDNTNSPLPISNCQKILREDRILILREGRMYTIMGAEVK